MKYNEMVKIISSLNMGERKTIFIDSEGAELYVVRPEAVPAKLKNDYDAGKNFQICLKHKYQDFKPNHLRVLIDLSLKARAQPKLKNKLLLAFDNIYYGNDPVEEVDQFKDITFPHVLNSMETIAMLAQLFLIEQDINYLRESHFDPKGLFFQGWVREFIDSPKELEIMCVSAARGQPPNTKYTAKENKKSKRYQSNLEPLWYLK